LLIALALLSGRRLSGPKAQDHHGNPQCRIAGVSGFGNRVDGFGRAIVESRVYVLDNEFLCQLCDLFRLVIAAFFTLQMVRTGFSR